MVSEHQKITANVSALSGTITSNVPSGINLVQSLSVIQEQLTSFVRSLYRHKRQAASNVYVMMISSELRQVKPYALPIQLLPYKSINESTMRKLICEIVKVMISKGRKVVGGYKYAGFHLDREKMCVSMYRCL